MAITAQQVTDSQGQQPISGDIYREDLKAHSLGESPNEDVWSEWVEVRECVLSRLLDLDKFSMLASRLININNYSPMMKVQAGSTVSGTRVIVTETEEFRARRSTVYSRKV